MTTTTQALSVTITPKGTLVDVDMDIDKNEAYDLAKDIIESLPVHYRHSLLEEFESDLEELGYKKDE